MLQCCLAVITNVLLVLVLKHAWLTWNAKGQNGHKQNPQLCTYLHANYFFQASIPLVIRVIQTKRNARSFECVMDNTVNCAKSFKRNSTFDLR
jgi:hypothetical protein